ncbi:hypothetical protein V2G26_014449 [Clonostachys chloroleuca]
MFRPGSTFFLLIHVLRLAHRGLRPVLLLQGPEWALSTQFARSVSRFLKSEGLGPKSHHSDPNVTPSWGGGLERFPGGRSRATAAHPQGQLRSFSPGVKVVKVAQLGPWELHTRFPQPVNLRTLR